MKFIGAKYAVSGQAVDVKGHGIVFRVDSYERLNGDESGPHDRSLISSKLLGVFHPLHEEDWFLLETDRGFYSLRLGGYAPRAAPIDAMRYKANRFPEGATIKEIHTDLETLYIRLSNNHVLIHGYLSIDSDGQTSAAVWLLSESEFRKKYGESFFDGAGLYRLE